MLTPFNDSSQSGRVGNDLWPDTSGQIKISKPLLDRQGYFQIVLSDPKLQLARDYQDPINSIDVDD